MSDEIVWELADGSVWLVEVRGASPKENAGMELEAQDAHLKLIEAGKDGCRVRYRYGSDVIQNARHEAALQEA